MSSILKVQNIQYTDGDAALTIADGGDVTLSGHLASGVNKNIDVRDADGHVSGRLRNVSGSNNALTIEADPDNSASGSYVSFKVDTSEKMKVDDTGDVTITNGDLVIGTAGHGIDFSVNTASSVTGTSNQDELLDHYEEGYFTPTIYGSSGSAGSQQINGQEGRYVKIGKLVYITLYFYLQNGGAGSWTGTNRFGGLPFTNGASNRQALSIGSDGLNHDEITFTITGGGSYGLSLIHISEPTRPY